MPSLKLRDRSLAQRSLLALVPVAVLAAVFALGVPGEGSGESCKTDDDCRDGEACGEDKCQSTAGGCGGEQDSGIGAASNQAEGAFEAGNNDTLGLNRAGTTSGTGEEGEGEGEGKGSPVAYTVSIGPHSYHVVSANGDEFDSTLSLRSFRTGLVTVRPVPPVFVYYGGAPPMCGKGQEGSDWGDCPAGQTCQSFPGGGFVCSGGGGGTGEEGEGEGEGEGESQIKVACDSPTRDPTRSSLTDSSASCIRDYCDEDGNGHYDSGDLGLVLLNYGSARYDTAVEILPNGPVRFPRFNPSYSPEYPEGSGESVNADDLAKYLAMMVGGHETKLGPCGPLPPAPDMVACDSDIWDPDSQCVRAYCDENGDGTIDAADLGLVLANYGPLSCDDSAGPCVPFGVSNVQILPTYTEFPRFNPAYISDTGRGEGEKVNGLDLAVYLATMVGDTSTRSGGCSLPDNPLKLACNTPTWDPVRKCMRDYCDEDGNGYYDSGDLGLVLLSYGSLSDPTPRAETLVQIRPKWRTTHNTIEDSFLFPRFNPAYDTKTGLTPGESVDKRDVKHYLKQMAVRKSAVLDCTTPASRDYGSGVFGPEPKEGPGLDPKIDSVIQ